MYEIGGSEFRSVREVVNRAGPQLGCSAPLPCTRLQNWLMDARRVRTPAISAGNASVQYGMPTLTHISTIISTHAIVPNWAVPHHCHAHDYKTG